VAPARSPAASPARRTIGLDEATRTALARQPELRQARATTEAAFARADQARSPLLPQVTGTATYQRATANFVQRPGSLPSNVSSSGQQQSNFDTFGYWNFGLNANQLIYDFGQTPQRWRASQSSAQAQAQTERATRMQAVLNVRTSFFQARAQKSLVLVARETLANQQRHLSQIQGFVDLGTRPEIDLAQARTDVANAKLQLINAENGYDTAKAQLNAAMGWVATGDYDVADDTLAGPPDEDEPLEPLVHSAFAARPELAALARQVEADERLIRSAKGGYGPSLGASTGLTDAGQNLDNLRWNWNASVTLTWPIFQGLLVPAQVREAEANLAATRAQKDVLEAQLRLEVEQARLAVRAAKAGITAAEEALVNARERLRLAEGRYQTGVGSIIELSDAQTTLVTAEGQRVTTDYNLASARAALLKALGRETL
jgi:outer membrane protein